MKIRVSPRCAVAVGAAFGMLALPSPAAAADVDAFVVAGQITGVFPGETALGGAQQVQYSITMGCFPGAPGGAPTYVEVGSSVQAGTCSTGGTGSGTMTAVGVVNGVGSGSVSLAEPDGTVTLNYSIVMVAGIAVLAAPLGYNDDGRVGSAVGVLQLVPSPPTSITGTVDAFQFLGVITAED